MKRLMLVLVLLSVLIVACNSRSNERAVINQDEAIDLNNEGNNKVDTSTTNSTSAADQSDSQATNDKSLDKEKNNPNGNLENKIIVIDSLTFTIKDVLFVSLDEEEIFGEMYVKYTSIYDANGTYVKFGSIKKR